MTAAEAIEGLEHLFAAEGQLDLISIRVASLSVPLVMGAADGVQELVGSLNLYSDTTAAFDPFDENLVRSTRSRRVGPAPMPTLKCWNG